MRNKGHIAGFLFMLLAMSLVPHQIFSRDLPSAPSLINKACEETLYKDLCLSTLSSFPGGENADLHDLAKMALKYASLNGSHVAEQFKTWLQQSTTDELAQQCLHDCSQNYEDAIEQLEDSIVSLDSKSYADVQTWLSAAMSDVESCGDGCNIELSLAQLNDRFSQLCSNALALVNQVAA